MGDEIDLLEKRVWPLVNRIANLQSVEFEPKSSELIDRICQGDKTAKYLFDSFVTASTDYQNCGGFVLTNAEQLEKIYRLSPPLREKELFDNRILLFAIDGDGSFFGFGLECRTFYHFDHGAWLEEELPWNQCCSAYWDTTGFCEYFEEEFKANL